MLEVRAPVFAHVSLIAAANAGVSGRTPPSPCTGSAMIAAVRADTAAFSAAGWFTGMNFTDGSNGSKGAR